MCHILYLDGVPQIRQFPVRDETSSLIGRKWPWRLGILDPAHTVAGNRVIAALTTRSGPSVSAEICLNASMKMAIQTVSTACTSRYVR